MIDPHTQLALLRQQRDATPDPALRAALDAAIAALEAALPAPAGDAVSGDAVSGDKVQGDKIAAERVGQITAQDHAQIGVANSGKVAGDFNVGGIRYEALIQVFMQAAGVAQPSDAQRELLESYLDGLAQRCDRLRLTGVVDWERRHGKAPTFTLSQVYVTLAATAWVTVDEADSEDSFKDALAAGNAATVLPQDVRRVSSIGRELIPGSGRGSGTAVPAYRLERPLLLTEALSQRRKLVLLGGPGSGKSTFLRHLAVMLARAGGANDAATTLPPGWSAGLLLPVYASLGGFAAWMQRQAVPCDGDSLWRYLLTSSEHDTLAGLGEALRRAFRRGRLLLLLDGLDEVADPALRVEVACAVAALAGRHQGYLALTCRSRSFTDAVALPLEAWGEPVALAPFNLGQIGHFVRGWYQRSVDQGAFDTTTAAQRAEQLIERMNALQTLRELGQTPLLLTIITILHYYEGKLPEDRADLYEDMTQLLLTRWTQQRREAGAGPSLLERLQVGGLREFQLRGVLETLAYRAHQAERSPDGRGLLERGAVREALITLFKQFDLGPGPANEKAELVLDYLEEESGLLLHEGGERYALPHLTYEEYMAGCHLVKQEATFQTLAYGLWQADATRWREVVLLALGRMVRADKAESATAWLHFLLMACHGQRTRSQEERQRAALFAAECLADIGGKPALAGVSTVDLGQLWAQLSQTLAELVAGTLLPAAERVRAGVYLGVLGDPRPGVTTLPPVMIRIAGGSFVIGSSEEEAEAAGSADEAYWLEQGDKETAERARTWYQNEINRQPLDLPAFALARYPVTNAQYRLFIADNGYDPTQPWWDEAGKAWLLRDDAVIEGLESYQRRAHKDQPEYWDHERFGIARPNHPVVGVCWYEAMAFCRWLNQHTEYNPEGLVYQLPSEAEWEFATRGSERRTYAWGDEEPDGERANFDQLYAGTTAVGCFTPGETPTGIADLTGTVWEWGRGRYRHYPYDPGDGREESDAPADKYFTLRGGSWYDLPLGLRAAFRRCSSPGYHLDDVGFRLARHPFEH